ncbi:MAG: glycosyltransferase family 4 protein [bacterium]|nr:glycosyltransferase family 4 protein [bacterium]
MRNRFGVTFVSSYIPRRCGIATFTNDLLNSVKNLNIKEKYSVNVAALNDLVKEYKYPQEVIFEINDKRVNDFKEAAYYLNLSDSDVVNIQHEFGLYGGESGSNILYLMETLNKPIVTTLHTVLEKPSSDQQRVLKEIAQRSSFLIVQSQRSLKMLQDTIKVEPHKIKFIPHGAHDVPFMDPAYYKDKFQLSEKKVLLTFGLLGPGKGLEDVINSLKIVVREYPDVMYIILGATHPNVILHSGESYRNSLENLVKQNGLVDNVMFINRFVETEELLEFILMSDIYVSPYRNKEQAVSGTLTFALVCGKAIISTPYWHAEELLSSNRGILTPFQDPEKMGREIIELLVDENKRNRLRKNAYDAGRNVTWGKTGASYGEIFHMASESFKSSSKFKIPRVKFDTLPVLPDVNMTHLKNLTDSTGIHQHAVFFIPNRNEGYCTDDNVRALMVALLHKQIFNDGTVNSLINTYLTFLHHAFNKENNLFRNFMSFDRKWLDDAGSEDCNGRVIFVLGYMIKNQPFNSVLSLAKSLFDQSIRSMKEYQSPRAMSHIIMGCVFYLHKFSGDREIRKILKTLSDRLCQHYTTTCDEEWKWFEEYLTYENARLPQALLMSGKFLNNQKYIKAGLSSLEWLLEQLYESEKKYISLVGNDGWYHKNKVKAKFDQQPLEIPALIDACYQAYLITEDNVWINHISKSFCWFLGSNVRQEALIDFTTGACYDGLNSAMLNENQGAESTICWLWSLHRMIRISQELQFKNETEKLNELLA